MPEQTKRKGGVGRSSSGAASRGLTQGHLQAKNWQGGLGKARARVQIGFMPLRVFLGLLAAVILIAALTIGAAQGLGVPMAVLALVAVLAALMVRRR